MYINQSFCFDHPYDEWINTFNWCHMPTGVGQTGAQLDRHCETMTNAVSSLWSRSASSGRRCGRCVSALPHLVLFAKNNRKKYFFFLSNRTEIQWNILLRSIVYLLSSVIGGGVGDGVIGFLAWQTGGPGLGVWGGSFFVRLDVFLSFFGFKWKENICPDVGLDGSTYPVSCHSKPPPLSLMYVKGWNVQMLFSIPIYCE